MSRAAGRRRHPPGAAARRGGRASARAASDAAHQGAGHRDRQPGRRGAVQARRRSPRRWPTSARPGKKVYAWGSNFNQAQYHLAAHADEVFLQPRRLRAAHRLRALPAPTSRALFDQAGGEGAGLPGRHLQVLRRALHPQRHVARKTARPPATTSTPPWQAYQADIAAARPKAAAGLARYVSEAPALLAAAGGDSAEMALDGRLGGRPQERRRVARPPGQPVGPSRRRRGFKHVEIWPPTSARVREDAPPGAPARSAWWWPRGPSWTASSRPAWWAAIRWPPDPSGPRGRRDQGRGAAGRQPGRQRHRVRSDPPRAGPHPQGRQAGGGVDGFGGGLRRLLDRHGRRRGVGQPDHHHRLDRHLRDAARSVRPAAASSGSRVDGVGTTPLAAGLDPRRPLDPQIGQAPPVEHRARLQALPHGGGQAAPDRARRP